MSFDSRERSLVSGQPIRLYQFTRGTLTWAYNSSDRDIQHNLVLFRTVRGGIKDDGIRQTGQSSPDTLKITAPADLEVAQLYRGATPSSEVALTIFARHFLTNDYLVIWSGGVRSVGWPAVDRCVISCTPLTARLTMLGLRLAWERTCPHALYSPACGVDRNLYRVEANVETLDGASVSAPAFASYPAGYFTGGYLEWAIGGGVYERRGIEQHQGSRLQLLGGSAGIVPGQALRLYPGCAQTTASCKSFNNLPNYGGIPHLAGASPFDGFNVF